MKLFSTLKAFVIRHERAVTLGALSAGLLWNFITLRRVDLFPETLVLYVHLGLAALLIFSEHLAEGYRAGNRFFERAAPFFRLALNFVFGSLFTIFFVFYAKGSSIEDSWPFLVSLFAVVLGIEFLKKRPNQFIFHLLIFFFSLLSFSIFTAPLAAGALGDEVFISGVMVALAMFAVFLALLFATGKTRIISALRAVGTGVVAIIIFVAALYGTNTLPPLPLVLNDIGVYHSVERQGDMYLLSGEPAPFLPFADPTVHASAGASLYVFSSVFTPSAIHTNIIHVWEKQDDAGDGWTEELRVSFPAEGGRDMGYRGYSIKTDVTPGVWRVSVETPEGLVIGRIEFTVIDAPAGQLVETAR